MILLFNSIPSSSCSSCLSEKMFAVRDWWGRIRSKFEFAILIYITSILFRTVTYILDEFQINIKFLPPTELQRSKKCILISHWPIQSKIHFQPVFGSPSAWVFQQIQQCWSYTVYLTQCQGFEPRSAKSVFFGILIYATLWWGSRCSKRQTST